jgi:predicted N-acetyltransferase YhbS
MRAEHGREGLALRRATRADDVALRAINASAFSHNPKERAEITRWQWWENPFGETLAWVWEDAGRVVAQSVAFCVPGVIGGRSCTLACGADGAVAPSHQGRRLFTPMWAALARDSLEHGWPVIAYPNERSWRGVRRAGWIEVARPRVHALVRNDHWLAARLRLPRLVARAGLAVASRPQRPRRGLAVAVVDSVPDDLEELWNLVAPSWANGIARGESWWRWRYGGHPDAPYRYLAVRESDRLMAAAAMRARHELVGGRFHCLLELLAADDDAARAVVAALADGAVGEADGIALTAVAGSTLERAAIAAGMRRVPSRLHRPMRFGVVPDSTLLADPRTVRWSTAWGDLDHF